MWSASHILNNQHPHGSSFMKMVQTLLNGKIFSSIVITFKVLCTEQNLFWCHVQNINNNKS